MPVQSLKQKTVHGVGWSATDNVLKYSVSFVVGVVLARLLSPDDYGLLGLIAIFTAISKCIINGGFLNALIRKKAATDDDYNTVFITNLGASLVLYAILFFCAPAIAVFFKRTELVALTRVSSLSIIIEALAIVQRARLTKRIDFKSQAQITVIASVSSGVVGISMALLGCGVWALVAEGLVSSSLTTIFLWIFNRWTPKFHFSKSSFTNLFGYSWKLLVSSLLDTTYRELYQVVVGKFYSPATLGQYTRSKQFANLFSSNLTSVVQRVSFPVLSEIQDDTERMKNAYRRVIKTTMLPTAVCMFALGAVAQPLIFCLIGEKWNEAAVYLPFICVSMSLYPLQAINLNMLQVQGRSDLFLVLEIIKKVIGLAPLFVGAVVGILPMLWVNIATGIICFFLNSHWSGKLIGYSSWMQIKDIAPSYGIAAILALSVYFFKYLPFSYWVILPIQIIVGCGVLLLLCEKTEHPEYLELKEMVLPVVRKFVKKNAK